MLKRTDPIDLVRAHMEALRRLGAAEDSPELMGHVEALEGALNAAQIGRHSQSTAPVEVHALAPRHCRHFIFWYWRARMRQPLSMQVSALLRFAMPKNSR